MGKLACVITWALLAAAGCVAEDGPQGPEGPAGPAGRADQCWDHNGDNQCTGREDRDGSGGCTISDCVGDVGAIGPQGPIGPAGPEGPAGPAGPAGIQGEVGLQGEQGPRGAVGPQGNLGPQGVQGVAGVQGPVGPRGPHAPLVAQYELDEVAGAAQFADSAGLGNTLSAFPGTVTAGSATAHAGRSVAFTGVQGLQAAANNTIVDSAYIAPELWLRTNQPGLTYTLLDKVGAYRLRMVNGRVEWTVNTIGGACTVTHDVAVGQDAWTHVAGLYDGLAVVVTVDGAARSAPCRTGHIVKTPGGVFTIGGKLSAGNWSEVFRGNLDEVRVRSGARLVVGRTSGTCEAGKAITAVAADGRVTCTAVVPQRVIRYNVFDTYLETCCWVADNRAELYGGINPSNWTNNYAMTQDMSPDAATLRTLFNRKIFPGNNALVNSQRWRDQSSTNGKVTVALMRIRNTTGAPIDWTPFFYYTAYAGWEERASMAVNGQNVWNSGGSHYSNSTAAVTVSLPANRTSTIIWGIPSSPPWSTTGYYRMTMLAFYNDSLALPQGLEFVDDLDFVQGNLW